MSSRAAGLALALVVVAGALTGGAPAAPAAARASALRVTGLTCEFSTNPLGIDVPAPRLSWRLESGERGQKQTAWQVLVASSDDRLAAGEGDLWDSGKVASGETVLRPYAGRPLLSSERVVWKVRSWDAQDRPSQWSAPATWTMGLLDRADWKGAWIAAPGESETVMLRHAFTAGAGLRRATVHVSGLGQYELSINGRRVGEDLFSPGWTGYDDTVLYDTFDVTSHVTAGHNAIGMLVGSGMYRVQRRNRFAKFTGSFGPLRAILHLRLEYGDGAVDVIGTSPDWRTHPGAQTFASIYGGEDHDARREPGGWDSPGFDDAAWLHAVPVLLTTGELVGHRAGFEPVRAIETRAPAAQRAFADGSVVYDFGQNASFVPRLRVSGPAGSSVRLTPAEVVNEDGTIFRGTMGGPHRGSSWWQYTKATDGIEEWFPRFYYLGSRYVKAEFLPPGADTPVDLSTVRGQLPRIESLESVVVHSTAPVAGQFRTSNERLNRIRDLVRWAQRSNMVSVLTDCPHREKLGWIEQFHLNGPAIRYEFDVTRSFAKAMRDMADAQTEDGLVPNIAPEYVRFEGPFRNAAEWGAAFILVPWQHYLFTGDASLMRTHFDAMAKYFAFLESRTRDGLLGDGLGDWYDLDLAVKGRANLTPAPITATAFLYEDARVLARSAEVLGRDADAARYRQKAEAIRARFLREFRDAGTGRYGTGSQASLALSLALGLAEPADRDRLLADLVRDVETRGYATAGDIGFRYLLRALAEQGRSDVILRLIDQDEKPGYGYQLKMGATALAEAWDANRGVSQNHFMLGQVTEWFYRDLVGIDVDESRPGFQHVLVRPTPVGDLAWVEGRHESIRGPVAVRWERSGGRFSLAVDIPPNVTATVWLPLPSPESTVTEGDAPLERNRHVRLVARETGRAVLEIASGRYAFEAR